MTEMIYEFTEEDKKIRKKWKRCALIVLCILPLGGCVLVYILDALEGNGYKDSLYFGWIAIKNLGWFFALTHFSYKKYGTSLLNWAIGLGILYLILTFLKVNTSEPSVLVGFLFEVCVMIWFFVRCSKLQDLNHRINKSVEDYKEEDQ